MYDIYSMVIVNVGVRMLSLRDPHQLASSSTYVFRGYLCLIYGLRYVYKYGHCFFSRPSRWDKRLSLRY